MFSRDPFGSPNSRAHSTRGLLAAGGKFCYFELFYNDSLSFFTILEWIFQLGLRKFTMDPKNLPLAGSLYSKVFKKITVATVKKNTDCSSPNTFTFRTMLWQVDSVTVTVPGMIHELVVFWLVDHVKRIALVNSILNGNKVVTNWTDHC